MTNQTKQPELTLGDQIERAYSTMKLTRAHLGVAAMVLLGAFFDSIEQNAVGVAGPALRESWGLGSAQVGLLNTVTFTAIALGRLAAGFTSDRFGRRRLLSLNLLVFSVGSLLCAVAPNYEMLLVARFIVGIGIGGEIATAITMMSEFFAAKHRGVASGLVNVAAAGIGNLLAPLFGIIVFAVFSGDDQWRYLFAVLLLPALLVLFYRRSMPESPRYLAANGNVAEANTVLNRLAQGKLAGPLPEQVQYLDGENAAALAEPPRQTWTHVFRGRHLRTTLPLCIAVTMSYGGQISMATLIPLILTDRGFAITTALWYTLVMQSGSLVGSIVASFVSLRLPRRAVLTGAATLGLVAALGFGFAAPTIPLVLLFGALFNFAVITINTTIFLYAPELYPTRIRGLGTAVILATGSLAGGLLPLLAGAVLDAGGVPAMFAMLAAFFVVGAIVVRIPRETLGRPLEEAF
ncbi:MAG: MFS transporter [Micropruina sp.]|uniref:MFS transporter n=1 Tax=Micropruina sp. TaxID=2737536 RepID=UPI0039E4B87B